MTSTARMNASFRRAKERRVYIFKIYKGFSADSYDLPERGLPSGGTDSPAATFDGEKRGGSERCLFPFPAVHMKGRNRRC